MSRRNASPEQIKRIDGNSVFMEVMNSAFGIDKVQLNFKAYDENKPSGSRFTQEVSIYLDVDYFLVLAQDLLSGRLSALANQAKEEATKQNKQYASELREYTDLGGISKETLAQRGQTRPDGKDLSRQFKITPGGKLGTPTNYPWILSGEQGPGEATDKGLISPKGKSEQLIRVPMTDRDFKSLVLKVKAHYEAFLAAGYSAGNFTYKKEDNGKAS